MTDNDNPLAVSRRGFLVASGALATIPTTVQGPAVSANTGTVVRETRLTINGRMVSAQLEPRITLLDFLRDRKGLTGTKKGCNEGACGTCTVFVDGKRMNACLVLAVQCDGLDVTTIEGVAEQGDLHPVQRAFIEHDAFQCGYCTPGQIMSAIACIAEGHAGSEEQVREWMSGNLCSCAAYPQITAAVLAAAQEERAG